ncbi:LpqB family beta-propeller domain-containing protein [Rhodococcus sp. IEGM 1408]|uniref:LpqB family beta-propeller domain-containing protein n=1 Tax=Rhodococcus sp. IEGM 1408 TaxID=3082220 RepID=UPI0029550F79|nr:LpqB family beta-propeller domain-containing protein [Rhodococcus sp. IEGM 1408]MDV8000879.1 LpqB family beta-propeller domain-containing protein [Rhodococcus sp. IEGM 1408]
MSSVRAVLGVVALACVAGLGATGCATLPSSSSPHVIDTFSPSATALSVPTPVPDQEPDLLVRDFLKAAATADQRHAASRQFLTREAAETWDDSADTTIVLRADLSAEGGRDSDRAEYTLRAEKVGSLDPGGIFREEVGQLEVTIGLARQDGQWRIDRLPPGVVIEKTEFFSTYAQRDLFFLSGSGESLVPDPRWTAADRTDLGYSLVNLLATGPRPGLTASVLSRVPSSVSVRPDEGDGDEGRPGTTIEFTGLPVLSSQATTQFAAQVVWTLARADVPGPYRLERDGAPLDERYSDGWTTEDVRSFDPYPPVEPMRNALTAADGLVRLEGAGARPAGGPWSEVRGGRSGSLSYDGRILAVVAGEEQAGSRRVLVGAADDAPREALTARTVAGPTFHPVDGRAWVMVDDARLVRIGTGASPSVQEMDAGPIRALGSRVTALRIDQSGTRLAVVVDGKVFIGGLSAETGQPLAGTFGQIGRALGETASVVAWRDRTTIVVGRNTTEAPVVTISIDGAITVPLSQRNITGPVTAVAAAGREVYVVDQRSLLRLDTAAETGDRYWREINGLAAIRADPVVAG